MSIKYEELKQEMPHKWKVQMANAKGCTCVAYVDSRQVQDKLDDVIGPANWTDDYYEINGQLFCRIGVKTEDGWVYKSDCGTESMTEKEKGQVSDAFKRAAVKWGVGRFLYSKKIQRTKSLENGRGGFHPADDNGKRIWDLTEHINAKFPQPRVVTPAKTSPVNTTEIDPKTGSKPGRYNADKGGANVEYKKSPYSEDTIKKVQSLEKDGKTGKDVLNDYLEKYNESKKKSFKKISDLSESDLTDLIKYIEDSPPADL